VLWPGRKKAARNAPKCHYSRLYRAGVFVPVVAQPIQDMSAVSITPKTVGVRLPRLWCGAGGLVCPVVRITQKRVSSSFFPLYVVAWRATVGGVFDPRRKRSEADPMTIYANVPGEIIIC
jgi:hypothetical protein